MLNFVRWGLNRAAPMFWFWRAGQHWSKPPKRADALAKAVAGREHHADWFAEIDHPDAKLITLAPELAAALTSLHSALEAEIAWHKGEAADLRSETVRMTDYLSLMTATEHETAASRLRAILQPPSEKEIAS